MIWYKFNDFSLSYFCRPRSRWPSLGILEPASVLEASLFEMMFSAGHASTTPLWTWFPLKGSLTVCHAGMEILNKLFSSVEQGNSCTSVITTEMLLKIRRPAPGSWMDAVTRVDLQQLTFHLSSPYIFCWVPTLSWAVCWVQRIEKEARLSLSLQGDHVLLGETGNYHQWDQCSERTCCQLRSLVVYTIVYT